MAISCGVDIVEISRIAQFIARRPGFVKRAFSSREISDCIQSPDKFASYAARFAAKEATMKALGTGWNNGIQFRQIDIFDDNKRQPHMELCAAAKTAFLNRGFREIQLSLCTTKVYVIALVYFY